jgi:nucleotide-binding universal stress UspA family protein
MKRIIVAMDLSDTDYRLLDYVRFIGEQFAPDKVYFVHVSPGLEVPEFARSWYEQENIVPLDERIKEEMNREIRLKIRPDLVDYELDVLEGNITEQLLHWSLVKTSDLAIVGKKERHLGSGLAARRFLHKTKGSVIFVPENAKARIHTILVPTDFSDYSTHALEKAIDLAVRMSPTPVIKLLNIYEIPNGIHYQISRTRQQFASMVRDNVKDYCVKYLKEIDTKGVRIECELRENTEYNTAFHIMNFARHCEADMIMMGAKGHHALERILLGSVTEKILSYDHTIPLYIVRPQEDQPTEAKKIDTDSRKDLTEAI